LNQIGTSIGTTGHETIVATYDYLDERGTLLYQVVRLAPKGFRQRRPGSNGRWVWNLKGTRRVLYRLPAVVAAISRGETIWVAEGEKDVHALEQAGVTATCNPMGAGKWRPEYTDTLATAEPSTWITLVADSDEAGHRHATDVAQRLQQAGCTVRLVQPAHGKDAHDHLAAGLGLDQFQPLDPATLQQTAAAGGPTVQDLVDTLASYQHLDDPGHVWFALAVAISSAAFDDEPLWGMLVGAPSSGKTETARALGNIAGHIDDLTAAGLLTWTRGKDPKPSGALMRIGKRGLTTIGDFSTVLAQSNKGNRDLLYSMLRRVYDGSLDRDLAAGKLHWRGRLTLLACCTPIIDDYSSHADALGPRWLYYRIHTRDTHTKRAMGLAARLPSKQGRAHAAELAEQLVEQAADRARTITIPIQLHAALVDLAIVCCYARAAVPRSGYGHREITSMAIVEDPPRLTKQLIQLAHATLALGAPTGHAYQLCRHAALDSIPQARRRVLEVLADRGEHAVSEVAREVGAHRQVARFALEELAAAGLLAFPVSYDEDETGQGGSWTPRSWRLDGPDTDLIVSVLTGSPDTKSTFLISQSLKKEEGPRSKSTSHVSDDQPEQDSFNFTDGPAGQCVSCHRECYSTDPDGRPRHPLCPPPDPRRHMR